MISDQFIGKMQKLFNRNSILSLAMEYYFFLENIYYSAMSKVY